MSVGFVVLRILSAIREFYVLACFLDVLFRWAFSCYKPDDVRLVCRFLLTVGFCAYPFVVSSLVVVDFTRKFVFRQFPGSVSLSFLHALLWPSVLVGDWLGCALLLSCCVMVLNAACFPHCVLFCFFCFLMCAHACCIAFRRSCGGYCRGRRLHCLFRSACLNATCLLFCPFAGTPFPEWRYGPDASVHLSG